jgi:hypothetical protein
LQRATLPKSKESFPERRAHSREKHTDKWLGSACQKNLQRLFYQLREFAEASLKIAADVDAQGAALAVGQNLEVSASLGRFYDSERVFLAWNL